MLLLLTALAVIAWQQFGLVKCGLLGLSFFLTKERAGC